MPSESGNSAKNLRESITNVNDRKDSVITSQFNSVTLEFLDTSTEKSYKSTYSVEDVKTLTLLGSEVALQCWLMAMDLKFYPNCTTLPFALRGGSIALSLLFYILIWFVDRKRQYTMNLLFASVGNAVVINAVLHVYLSSPANSCGPLPTSDSELVVAGVFLHSVVLYLLTPGLQFPHPIFLTLLCGVLHVGGVALTQTPVGMATFTLLLVWWVILLGVVAKGSYNKERAHRKKFLLRVQNKAIKLQMEQSTGSAPGGAGQVHTKMDKIVEAVTKVLDMETLTEEQRRILETTLSSLKAGGSSLYTATDQEISNMIAAETMITDQGVKDWLKDSLKAPDAVKHSSRRSTLSVAVRTNDEIPGSPNAPCPSAGTGGGQGSPSPAGVAEAKSGDVFPALALPPAAVAAANGAAAPETCSPPSEETAAAAAATSDQLSRGGTMRAADVPVSDSRLAVALPSMDTVKAFADGGYLNWDANMLELRHECAGRPLFMVFLAVLRKFMLDLRLQRDKLHAFAAAIDLGYNQNHYHNSAHAADVVNSANVFVTQFAPKCTYSSLELLSLFVSAAIHDIDHGGLNNNYHMRTKSELAIRYSDSAVMERHHLSVGFRILLQGENNIVSHVTEEEYKTFRALVIKLVMATDLSTHVGHVSQFQNMDPEEACVNAQTVLLAAIKFSDLSHAAKPLDIHIQWTNAISEEFFEQGDREISEGLAPSFLCSRDTNVAQSQIGFFNFMIEPFARSLSHFLPDMAPAVANIAANKEHWKEVVEGKQEAIAIKKVELAVISVRRTQERLASLQVGSRSSTPKRGVGVSSFSSRAKRGSNSIVVPSSNNQVDFGGLRNDKRHISLHDATEIGEHRHFTSGKNAFTKAPSSAVSPLRSKAKQAVAQSQAGSKKAAQFTMSNTNDGADGDVKIPQPGRKMENLVVYLGATKQIEKRMQEAKKRRTPNGRDKEASAATEED